MATLYESFDGTRDSSQTFGDAGDKMESMSFTAEANYAVGSVALKLHKSSTGTMGTITVNLKAADGSGFPSGPVLATGTTDGDAITATAVPGEWVTITLVAAYGLTKDIEYCWELDAPGCDSGKILSLMAESSNPYATGRSSYSDNGGSSWNAYGGTGWDGFFKNYGLPTPAAPTSDSYTTKKLVVLASDELWYESSPGTMSQLAASVGQIDTSDFISVCEAYGKAFIANGSNLKIADFINVKITTTNVGSHPPDFGTELTGGTSGAKMTVDYIDALSGAVVIYGKLNTTATFEAETVTGTDDDNNAISFTGTAQVTGPHWYNWTVWGNSSTYGVMPGKASLVCTYKGRLVLSGNEDEGHMWWMSKVFDPFNYVYSATDPLTAVAGNNVTAAGQVGDVIRALIPYGDDYLLFGCDSSIHLLDGDAAHGGSIDDLSKDVGIYGSAAWCKDSNDNLYLFGTEGIYLLEGGRAKPQHISRIHLPNLISDWSPSQATKRIVLTYDPKEDGVLATITTLADGTNLGYFYSLKTKGFYPESAPTACGVYCSFNYDAIDSTYKGLIYGSFDGYLREQLAIAKDDDSGASNTAISSYVTYPIQALGEDEDHEGKLTSLVVSLAGGAANGAFSDSDQVTWSLYKANDAETCLEDIQDGATAFATAEVTGTGRKTKTRPRMRGAFYGLKLSEATASKTWAINQVSIQTVPAGKIR